MTLVRSILLPCLLLSACTQQPVIDEQMKRIEGELPTDLSGSWERNYTRDDDVNAVLRRTYNRLSRTVPDQQDPRAMPVPTVSARDVASLTALARLAELITRPDVLTISQNDREISVARKDDFALLCAFHDGVAKGTDTPYGTEICGWDGEQLVSNLVLPQGLQVTHRFTVSEDGEQLRVVTTLSSTTSRVPFSLQRFYSKFREQASEFHCIETLSMKRVCSTSEILP